MYKKTSVLFALFLMLVMSSCATGITSGQRREMAAYQAKGIYVQEKSPTVGAVMGILPGGGSFYAREYGYGVFNAIMWPASIAWDPVSGIQGAERINYYATKEQVNYLQKREKKDLNRMLAIGKIDTKLYLIKQQEIEDKYSSVY